MQSRRTHKTKSCRFGQGCRVTYSPPPAPSSHSHTLTRSRSEIKPHQGLRGKTKIPEVKEYDKGNKNKRKTTRNHNMAIGKNSRKSSMRSSTRAPKFLDKSSGFYGRLDEPETSGDVVERWNGLQVGNSEGVVASRSSLDGVYISGTTEGGDPEVLTEGIMEDDGETLLRRKPSRNSSRWRRSSKRKQEGEAEKNWSLSIERPNLDSQNPVDANVMIEVEMAKLKAMEEVNEEVGRGKEPALVHFPLQEDADDQVLIRDKRRGREEEGKEERRMRSEQEEGMKVVKRKSIKNYGKVLDRAFRRGWEAFISNLYSVALTPVTPSSSSSPSSKMKHSHKSVLTEFQ